MDHPAVALRPDDPASRLHHLLHAGVQVGVVVAFAEHPAQALPDLLIDGIDLWQTESGDESTDQAIARQIDTLAKSPTQNGKAYAAVRQGKSFEKVVALTLG